MESKKNEIKLEKINRYDPFSDEPEYLFYNTLLDLKPIVPIELLEKKAKTNKENEEIDPKVLEQKLKKSQFIFNILNLEEEKAKNYEILIQKIIKVDSKEAIDEMTIEFINKVNSVKNRKALVRCMLKGSRTNYAILKYFARFTANVSQYFKDFAQDLHQALIEEYNILQKDDKVNK